MSACIVRGCKGTAMEADLFCPPCWKERLRKSPHLCRHPARYYDEDVKHERCAVCEHLIVRRDDRPKIPKGEWGDKTGWRQSWVLAPDQKPKAKPDSKLEQGTAFTRKPDVNDAAVKFAKQLMESAEDVPPKKGS